jgi:hypothetical protein
VAGRADEPAAASAAPAVATRSRDEASHLGRLGQALHEAGTASAPRPRDPSWQQGARRREQGLRNAAADLADQLRQAGLGLRLTAALLDVPERTLRQWRQQAPGAPACPLGRPHRRCEPDEAAGKKKGDIQDLF